MFSCLRLSFHNRKLKNVISIFIIILATQPFELLAQETSMQNASPSASDSIPAATEDDWIKNTTKIVEENKSPVVVVSGVGVLDNTSKLVGGYQDAAQGLERELHGISRDFVITFRNGEFKLYDPQSDIGRVEDKGVVRNFGEGLASFFGQDRIRNVARKKIQKSLDKINSGKNKTLAMHKKLELLQTSIDPILKRNQASVALIVRGADKLMPKDAPTGQAAEHTAVAEFFRDLSTRQDFASGQGAGKPFTTILLTESEKGFNENFVKGADYTKVEADLPGHAQRKALIDRYLQSFSEKEREAIEAKLFENVSRDNFLRRSHGMESRSLLALLDESLKKGGQAVSPITIEAIKKFQSDSLVKVSNGMIEPLDEIKLDRSLVAGSEAKKGFEWLDQTAEFLRNGQYHLMPYFFGVGGASGTGKTFLFEVVNGEADSPFTFYKINFSQANSKWVGELGKNLDILGRLMDSAPPGTVFLFDEVLSKIGDAKGEGAGADAAREFHAFLREKTEDMKKTGKMVGFMDSALGLEVAGVSSRISGDEFTRMIDRLVFLPAFNSENKKALLVANLKKHKIPQSEIEEIVNWLDDKPQNYEIIPPVAREIDGLVQRFNRKRQSHRALGAVENFRNVFENSMFTRPPDWYAKWVASWFMFDSKEDMPPHVRKWFDANKQPLLKEWITQWDRGGSIKPEQLEVLLADSFDGHEKILSGASDMDRFNELVRGMKTADDSPDHGISDTSRRPRGRGKRVKLKQIPKPSSAADSCDDLARKIPKRRGEETP